MKEKKEPRVSAGDLVYLMAGISVAEILVVNNDIELVKREKTDDVNPAEWIYSEYDVKGWMVKENKLWLFLDM